MVRSFRLARLLRDHDLTVGIEGLALARDAAEVDLGRHLHARGAGADDAADNVFDLRAHAVFERGGALVGTDGCGAGLTRAAAKHRALFVDNGHGAGVHAGNGGSDEVLDRDDLRA